MVSCSDYDDDINNLNQRVDDLAKTVEDLKSKIEAGAVISSVNTIEDGVEVVLSNGEKYTLKNGADGKAGSVVTMGDNGNWFIDGVDSGRPWKGEKGDQGEQGPQGPEGPQGPAGDSGQNATSKYYKPGDNGFWIEVTVDAEGNETEEETTQSWTPEGTMTAVYDTANGRLLISNVEGVPAGTVLVIETWGELKSLAVIPYVIDKETNMPVVSFYNIVKGGKVLESTDAKAHFRLNPNNANIEGWEWSIIDRKVITRAEGDNVNDLLEISKATRADGELVVSLKSKKSLADLQDNQAAIFALNGMNTANGNNIVSDYAQVTSEDLTNFSIVNSTIAPEQKFDNPYSVVEPAKTAEADAELVYGESLDLNTLVETWAKDINATSIKVTLEDLDIDGLTYTFTKPETYLGDDNQTNQQAFINVDENTGVVTVGGEAGYETSSIGKTPIVVAHAWVNGTEIATGYIKLEIVKTETPAEPLDPYIKAATAIDMEYEDIVAGRDESKFTWEEMNKVYDALQLTRESFKANYDYANPVVDYSGVTGLIAGRDGITITPEHDFDDLTATNIATISLDPTGILSTANGKVTLTYKAKDNKKNRDIVIEFPLTLRHSHANSLEFNQYFVTDEVAMLRGRKVGNNWENSAEISEHFTNDLSQYSKANHKAPYLELVNPVVDGGDVYLSEGTLANQEIKLVNPIATPSRDVKVRVVEELLNGKESCTFEYTVRFINPFKIELKSVTLLSPLGGAKDTEDIKDGEIIVKENMDNGRVLFDGKDFTSAADTYSMSASNTVFDYEVVANNTAWKEYGSNNDGSQKLSIDASGIITWDNAGTSLEQQIDTTYKVTVKVGNIGIVSDSGVLTVKRTVDSNN